MKGYELDQVSGDIYLNANEARGNLSEEALVQIHQVINEVAFQRYPDESNQEIIQAYSEVSGIDENKLMAGHGSDEMLGFMISYFLGNNKKAYTLSPDFSMYDYYCGMNNATLIKYPTNEDGSFDIDAFIKQGLENKIDMILFSNPNNPSGHACSNHDLIKIVEAFKDIPVIIDEAYGEFNDESMLAYLDTYDNLYITRTLSKAYGLASLRLGFLISNEDNISKLRKLAVPYNISTLSQKIGAIVLKDKQRIEDNIKEVKVNREALYQALSQYQVIQVYPSKANYLYGKSDYKEQLLSLLYEEGIVIRDFKNSPYFRITIGNKEENDLVIKVVTKLSEVVNHASK